MSNIFVERIENLIRVVSAVPNDKYDHRRWMNSEGCGCAIGHSVSDAYFVSQGFNPIVGGNASKEISAYLGISEEKAQYVFIRNWVSKAGILASLRVLLMELSAKIGMAECPGGFDSDGDMPLEAVSQSEMV